MTTMTVRISPPVLRTPRTLKATDVSVHQDSLGKSVKFKITVMISRARTVERVHPGQLPISVNARAITRDQHVTHPSP